MTNPHNNLHSAIRLLRTSRPNGIPQSVTGRVVFTLILVAVVLFIGHHGLRLVRFRSGRMPDTLGAVREQARWAGDGEFDLGNIPAPPAAERPATVAARGGSGALTLHYFSRSSPAEVTRFYQQRMPELGWREQRDLDGFIGRFSGTMLFYSNTNGDSCIIVVSDAEAGAAVTIVRVKPEDEMMNKESVR